MTFTKAYRVGETKYIDLIVRSRYDLETAVVTSAGYTLTAPDGTTTSGTMTVNSSQLSALLSPTQRGQYTMTVTYSVSGETIIEDVIINVC